MAYLRVENLRMKICLPIKYQPHGGMYTFVWNFRRYVQQHGIAFTDNIEDEYDVLFVNSWVVPYETIYRVKRTRSQVCVVQRVDGSARDYGRFDNADAKQAQVNLLADLTIFQSHYSKYSSTQKYRIIHKDGPIIYNPVETRVFTPNGPCAELPAGRARVLNVSWSTNPKKGTWQIADLAKENSDIVFVLCGRYNTLPDLPNIHLMGHLDISTLARVMRSCDVFLNLSENDPCPNVVLEALSSGLPVLYKRSGGVPELVEDCGVSTEPDSFRESLEHVMVRREDLSRRARERVMTHFAPELIFPQYLTAIESAEPRPLPSSWTVLRLAANGYPVLRFWSRPVFKRLRRWTRVVQEGWRRG
jgi:glycosyltransferase involved in cell wall biosynthesis